MALSAMNASWGGKAAWLPVHCACERFHLRSLTHPKSSGENYRRGEKKLARNLFEGQQPDVGGRSFQAEINGAGIPAESEVFEVCGLGHGHFA
jgi:hypothetical protein